MTTLVKSLHWQFHIGWLNVWTWGFKFACCFTFTPWFYCWGSCGQNFICCLRNWCCLRISHSTWNIDKIDIIQQTINDSNNTVSTIGGIKILDFEIFKIVSRVDVNCETGEAEKDHQNTGDDTKATETPTWFAFYSWKVHFLKASILYGHWIDLNTDFWLTFPSLNFRSSFCNATSLICK